MKKICGIYKITNELNGMSYIGLSKDIMTRWSAHKKLYLNTNSVAYDKHLYRAFRKYGIKNFSWTILEECDKQLLEEREIYWVHEYDTYYNGYNMTSGGSFECERSESTKRKISESKYKKVYCVELDKHFNSVMEAAEILNIQRAHIGSVCKNNRNKVGGYIFLYSDSFDTQEELEDILNDRKNKREETEKARRDKISKNNPKYKARKVRCIELDRIFDSCSDASRELNLCESKNKGSYISSKAKNGGTAYGYTWEYV